MKSTMFCTLAILIGLGFGINAFGRVEYLHLPINQPTAGGETRAFVSSLLGKLPLAFIPNEGQLPDEVAYSARAEGAAIHCTSQGIVFGFAGGNLRLSFVNGCAVVPQGRKPLPGKTNFLLGSDPALWRTGVPTYEEVVYQGVYPGIDAVYSGVGGRLKYTFHVAPGADVSQIVLRYEGIKSLSIDGNTGDLVIQTEWCPGFRDEQPLAYQEVSGIRHDVPVSFRVIDTCTVGFVVESYDPRLGLTIDPGYSTYLGGSSWDEGHGIAVDASGNAYVTGYTRSFNFPTREPYQELHGGNSDVFVAKFTNTGELIYSTYLGGIGDDWGRDIAVDTSGNIYVTGYTESLNFPTQNAYQSSYQNNGDAFVAKLDSSGNSLVYSTYLGGSNDDEGYGIAVDASGNAYVTGDTQSSNFPTQNAYQESSEGGNDVFITKFTNTGTLVYSTYLGGSNNDQSRDIAVDASGNVYVTGDTQSSNFPIQDAYLVSLRGDRDAFVTKLNSSGNGLVYSTYLGGSNSGFGLDYGYDIAVDTSGNAYITGYTESFNFPTQNAYQGSLRGDRDVFITKFTDTGILVYSTYLGGNGSDWGYDIDVDSSGSAYVTGYTRSSDFPTRNAYQGSLRGDRDAFVTKLNSSGNGLVYSTYLGGSNPGFGLDYGYDIAVNTSGSAYVAGATYSSDFPTQNPYQKSLWGELDAFVATFFADGSLSVELSAFSLTPTDEGVLIQWRTESEVNNFGFTLYRSTQKDGPFTKLGFVLGQGNTSIAHDYTYLDTNAEEGKIYFYFIEDVDISGQVNRTRVISIRLDRPSPKFALYQNYPNPFNPETWIPYDLGRGGKVEIQIYDGSGRLVRELRLGYQPAGSYVSRDRSAHWDGEDARGEFVSSGMYFYHLRVFSTEKDDAGEIFHATRKMLILK